MKESLFPPTAQLCRGRGLHSFHLRQLQCSRHEGKRLGGAKLILFLSSHQFRLSPGEKVRLDSYFTTVQLLCSEASLEDSFGMINEQMFSFTIYRLSLSNFFYR